MKKIKPPAFNLVSDGGPTLFVVLSLYSLVSYVTSHLNQLFPSSAARATAMHGFYNSFWVSSLVSLFLMAILYIAYLYRNKIAYHIMQGVFLILAIVIILGTVVNVTETAAALSAYLIGSLYIGGFISTQLPQTQKLFYGNFSKKRIVISIIGIIIVLLVLIAIPLIYFSFYNPVPKTHL